MLAYAAYTEYQSHNILVKTEKYKAKNIIQPANVHGVPSDALKRNVGSSPRLPGLINILSVAESK